MSILAMAIRPFRSEKASLHVSPSFLTDEAARRLGEGLATVRLAWCKLNSNTTKAANKTSSVCVMEECPL